MRLRTRVPKGQTPITQSRFSWTHLWLLSAPRRMNCMLWRLSAQSDDRRSLPRAGFGRIRGDNAMAVNLNRQGVDPRGGAFLCEH